MTTIGCHVNGRLSYAVPLHGVGRGECEPFVAVDEGVVAGDGVQQGRGLGVQVGVGVLAERRSLRAGQGSRPSRDPVRTLISYRLSYPVSLRRICDHAI
jgi:hypothetical protein